MNKSLISSSSSKGIKFNARKLVVNLERYIYNTLPGNYTPTKQNKAKKQQQQQRQKRSKKTKKKQNHVVDRERQVMPLFVLVLFS